jgi:hypothetical protein
MSVATDDAAKSAIATAAATSAACHVARQQQPEVRFDLACGALHDRVTALQAVVTPEHS